MVYINEFLPNPAGPDAAGEFVELYNDGNVPASLDGYALGTGGSKKASLTGHAIPARGYLVLKKEQTKLPLKNADGIVLLYGPDGAVTDKASFLGSAIEGKSFSRADYRASRAQHFAFADPTPGAANAVASAPIVAKDSYPFGVPLRSGLSLAQCVAMAAAVGIALALIFFYAFYKNENISHFLFGGDKASR